MSRARRRQWTSCKIAGSLLVAAIFDDVFMFIIFLSIQVLYIALSGLLSGPFF